ncbi:MAG: hypothetical protein K9K66_05630 [Desulfarculaceae bacterium]|nr:hypothetical protein [Desulfarculaceae bacterium]MCF8071275.1 hypothetical protein [Desulfarculaceae bacterium]MCF8101122.1 hypothetical protein [Desulfarculaceae bacterium]MCF8115329.1 hypothetical protein [Desulfarculaceae bacterium]
METKPANKRSLLRTIPWWVKSLILLSFTGVICYKILITPMDLKFDFPSFLALLLALFSVGLAAMFYFKATDTSNVFYNNTYKFTRDIADLLVKIESGFGEKLRHLEEAYTGMQDRFDQLPSRIEVKDAKRELREEEKELQEIIKSKEALIEELLTKTQMRDEEKQQFLEQMKLRDQELQEAQNELTFLRRRLNRVTITNQKSNPLDKIPPAVKEFIKVPIIEYMGADYVASRPTDLIQRRYNRVKEEASPSGRIGEWMFENGILDDDGDLTPRGASIFRLLAGQMV